MRKSYVQLRQEVSYDGLLSKLRTDFGVIKDHRGKNVSYSLPDVLLSAYAMFSLKYGSLLDFEKQSKADRANLHQIFGIKQLCSDAQMRSIVDEIPYQQVEGVFDYSYDLLGHLGLRKDYEYLGKHLIITVDGVQFFRSEKIHCANCCTKKHRDGKTSYAHSLLSAVMVHPDRSAVFPIANEPIQKQDGVEKNDCELNAAKRLLDKLGEKYAGQPLLLVEDALYSNAPHLSQILSNGWNFIVGVKPDSHKQLFAQMEARINNGTIQSHSFVTQGVTHRFYWINNTTLNSSSTQRVNFLHYEQEKKGKITRFSWVTSLPLHARCVEAVMRAGRARWKIENETFNTLKNQGYHFEHNYGHGYKHLSNTLAFLMMIAFLFDQIIQVCNSYFQRIWAELKTKSKIWSVVRSLFMTELFCSFNEIYLKIADLFEVKLE